MFKTIKNNVSAEIVEKKSKFIANIFYVETKEEAEKLIKEINKKFHDARHNCYAYRITCDTNILEKSSDDGEPSGTAGAPMLKILSKKNISNILVIVTRYFGGILLGTGGLVRAYSAACTTALENAIIIEKSIEKLYRVEITYTEIDKFKHFSKKNNIKILKEEYLENIILEISIKNDQIFEEIKQNDIKIQYYMFIKDICVE